MKDMDKILKAALSPSEYPSNELNEKIMQEIKESGKMKVRNKKFILAAVIAIGLLIIPASVYGAYRYLLPNQAAKEMEDEELSSAFKNDGTEVLQTVTDGSYKVTYLGHVTGEALSERTGSAWELHPDRIYVAAAIEKTDGTKMSEEDSSKLFISPLIQGLRPWSYNIASMNGSYMEKVINGVLYRIIECDNIEIFADKNMYLAVSDNSFYNNDAFQFDEKTGLITVKDSYKGLNILFELKLDSSKADPKKAKAYLSQLEKEWNADSDLGDKESSQENKDTRALESGDNKRIQKEEFKDDNGITIQIKENDSSRGSAGVETSQTVLSYYFKVEGENIESITYTLNKGEFCSRPEHNVTDLEFYGKKCSLTYKEQKDRNYMYNIQFKAKFTDYGYKIEEIRKLGFEDMEKRSKIEYEVLNKEIQSTTMGLEIKMKDGRSINKTVSFDNVLEDEGRVFWIALEVK